MVVLPTMTFSASMGLSLWREGIVGNISCLLATTPSSHTCPSLHCEEVLYSTVTSCTTPECTFQTNVNTCSCVSSVELCYWMSVMPVNTCITGSATALWAVCKLPTNHCPVSLRQLCCSRDHRNGWKVPEYSRISSAWGTRLAIL